MASTFLGGAPAKDGRAQAKHRGSDPSAGQKLMENFVGAHPREMPKERSIAGGSPSKEKEASKRGEDAQAEDLAAPLASEEEDELMEDMVPGLGGADAQAQKRKGGRGVGEGGGLEELAPGLASSSAQAQKMLKCSACKRYC